MITKYGEYIKENNNVDPYFFQTYEETKNWLDSMKIYNYTINSDLTVDVKSFVKIQGRSLEKIPVQFGKVNEYFDCDNNSLSSLKGCPVSTLSLHCCINLLTDLKYSPQVCYRIFDISDNKLLSLDGLTCSPFRLFIDSNYNLQNINSIKLDLMLSSISKNEVWVNEIKQEVWDTYFEYWIDKDSKVIDIIKNKISDNIKTKYDYLFNANNFDLL